MTDKTATLLAVDDQPANLRLLDAHLSPRGYRVLTAASGVEALQILEEDDVDLALLDIVMPEIDGYELCRRIRSNPATEFLPVVMITASGDAQRLAALEAGADDFVTKPFDRNELLARVASLVRIKRYQDTIARQAEELNAWNRELEDRVEKQVAELERINRLRHFLSPQLAELVTGDEDLLRSHRREIVVFFADLRNFTPFAETSEPEEVMGVLGEYHRAMGTLVHQYGGTLERFTGDGVMVFFNDPIPYDDAAERAVRMAIGIRDAVRDLSESWRRKGHDLALGMGIDQGYATLGRIGFEGRFDYSAIGSVTNRAARLCAEARGWQVLVSDRVLAAVDDCGLPGAEVVGMPVRSAITTLDRAALRSSAREHFGFADDAVVLLVFGGSQGAASLNRAVSGAAADLAGRGISVLHAHGPKNTLDLPRRGPGDPPYVAVPYLDRMDLAYAAADLAICRSGAMTVAEVSATGLPAVYVPLPHGNGEQELNALPVVQAGGGLLVPDDEMSPDWVAREVPALLGDPARLAQMAANAAVGGHRDAATRVACAALELAEGHRGGR